MTQLVVNGKNIYSDKSISSIIGTRVTFSDGSWCDAATGQVVNNGLGYINIDSPEKNADEKITEGPKTFPAHNLEIQNVVADFDIQVHQNNVVEVTITGPANEVKNIQVKLENDVVIVEGKKNDNNQGGIFISGNNSFIRAGRISVGSIVVGRSIVVNGNNENKTKVSVRVPIETSIYLANISGNTVIGDTNGPLQVSTNSGNVSAGCVGNASLSIQGSSDINIKEVNGTLTVNIMGSGDVSVNGGKVDLLTINVMGSGDARYNGLAETANLSVMGSGDIRVANVKHRPYKRVLGSGDIYIGNW